MQSQHEAEKQRLQNRMHLEHRQHKMREEVLEKKLMETKRLLAKAERSLETFRAESDWKEPDHLDLNRTDSRAFQQAFEHVDRKLDIKLQLKHDPTGALATFWSEQRRRLHVNKRAKWNPQVASHTFTHIYMCRALHIHNHSHACICYHINHNHIDIDIHLLL